MATQTPKSKGALIDAGEQLMLRPRKTERDFSILATVSKRTVNCIECVITLRDLSSHFPTLAQAKTGIASLLKPTHKVEIAASYTRDGGVYTFHSVTGAKISGTSATLLIELPSAVRKSQRRRDFRLPLAAKLTIRVDSRNQKLVGSLVNLSATGAMVDSPVQLQTGDVLECIVNSSEDSGQIDPIMAKVIECITGPDTNNPAKICHTLRLAFDDGNRVKLPNWQREQIAHYIFEQQRQMLRLRNIVG